MENKSKKSIYRNLMYSMLAFGAFVGIVFPPFAKIMLGTDEALSIKFLLLCIFAGLLVGGFNYLLFTIVVSKQLRRIVDGMKVIIERSKDTKVTPDTCETFFLKVESNDYIGRLADYFNEMSLSVCHRIGLETYLKNLSSQLSKTMDINELSSLLLEHLMQLSKASAGAIYGNRENRFIKLVVLGIDETDSIPLTIDESYGIINLAIHKNEITRISLKESGFKWMNLSTPFGTMNPENITVIPIAIDSQVVAIAILAGQSIDISEDKMRLIESVRFNTATYINNALLHDRIKTLAAIDDLTQLLNRRFGIKRLKEEFSRSLRHGIPLSLIMIDIDHFKSINDNFGHDAGDEVLRFLARNLEKGLRASDVVCRYGGEEFLIIAGGAGLSDAGKIAERMRLNIEKSSIKIQDKELKVNISLGIATWPICKASNSNELISDADRALYFAKEHGRNQVILYDGTSFTRYSG